MIRLPCGICGYENRPPKSVFSRLINFTRRDDSIFKCKKCDSTLDIVRNDDQCKMRWIDVLETN